MWDSLLHIWFLGLILSPLPFPGIPNPVHCPAISQISRGPEYAFRLKYRPHLPFFLCVAYPASTFCSRGAVRPWPDSQSPTGFPPSCPLLLGFTFHRDSYRGSLIPQSLASVWRYTAADRIAEPLKKAVGCWAQLFLLGEKPADRKHLWLRIPPMASSVSAQDGTANGEYTSYGTRCSECHLPTGNVCVLTHRLDES